MKKLTNWLKFTACFLLLLAGMYGIYRLPPKQIPPDPQVAELVQKVQQLEAELADVKSVQGYRAWEMDWRNRRDGQ